MASGGDGPWAVAVMWSLAGVVFVFVLLRIYTRAIVVTSFGVDDHVYNLAFVRRLLQLLGLTANVFSTAVTPDSLYHLHHRFVIVWFRAKHDRHQKSGRSQ